MSNRRNPLVHASNHNQNIVEFWRANPEVAAKDLLGVTLDNHEILTIRYRWKHNVHADIWSRGAGKTMTNATDAWLRASLWPGNQIGLLGPSFRQAKYIFRELNKIWEQSDILKSATIKHPTVAQDMCRVELKPMPGHSGSFIEAIPLGEDGGKARGSRYFSIFVDEAPQHKDEILKLVIRPMLATTRDPMANVNWIREQKEMVARGEMKAEDIQRPDANKLVLSSSAFYQWNHWWRRVNEIMETVQKNYRNAIRDGAPLDNFAFLGGPHNEGQIANRVMSDGERGICAFNCFDPSDGFINMKSVAEARNEMSDTEWRMEYLCLFPSDSNGFFTRSLLDAARRNSKFNVALAPRDGCTYTMGIDPARSNDRFAIAIYEIEPILGAIRLVRVLSWHNVEFGEMVREVRSLIRLYRMKYFEMDAGGGGTHLRDLLARPEFCPPGEPLILEKDFEGHVSKSGEYWLGPLFQFSSPDLVRDTNNSLLGALQHGRVQIASETSESNQIWTPAIESAEEELERAMVEMASIVKIPVGTRERWDTPTKSMRKDRYSAILVGYHAAQQLMLRVQEPSSLAMGGWG